jgi:hypothetical protein
MYSSGFSRTAIGTAANGRPRKWTMNLGTVDRPTVLHETGHALALLHEHQSPFIPEPILWNESRVQWLSYVLFSETKYGAICDRPRENHA